MSLLNIWEEIFENDYNLFESIILDCINKGVIDDAVIGKDDKEQVNIWGIREMLLF